MRMSAPGGSAEGRISEVDGLRGLAISSVLVWHLFAVPSVLPLDPDDLIARSSAITLAARASSLTFAGVDLFFVLSGFLITRILVDTRARKDYYRRFWLRRAGRILPVYYAVLAVSVLFPSLSQKGPLPPVWMSVFFLQNLWMSAAGTLGADVIAVTWSLAIE
jgi:peptidoglycan/LPS O-acetylase OafA/YrhL